MTVMNADLSELHHKYKAKRSGQSRIDYASAIQGYRRPSSLHTVMCFILAVVLVVGSLYLGITA